jgi:hypothetical protein
MKFFEKQRVDLVGTTSVTLQKILIFLMLLSVFTLFNGGLFSFLLCLLGFVGAYKKHTGLLRAYVTISVALMVIAFVFALVATFSVVGNTDYEYYSSSSSENVHAYSKFGQIKSMIRSMGSSSSAAPTDSSNAVNSSVESSSNDIIPPPAASDNFSSSYYEEDYTVFIFLAIVVMVLAFFVVYLKIYSLVLAHRLRKLILLSKESLPTSTENTHEFTPANTSCAVPNENETPAPVPTSPMFAHPPTPSFTPGFAPYPYPYPYPPMMPMMHPQMGGQQMPHHVMYGQQPIFYTYAPMPQPPAPADEKL